MSLADQIIEHGPVVPGEVYGAAIVASMCDSEMFNELRDELIAARALKQQLAPGRFEVDALGDYLGDAKLWVSCRRCPWDAEIPDSASGPTDLAELVQRATEHAEACR